jgi:hypothetical protein
VPIRVDLVIDVGNSRTCGILIESDPDDNDRLDLSKSYILSLRDLSRPNQVHALPFESRVEFSKPSFGNEGVSRLSGRTNAFYWPSLTRIGPEAVRLSVGCAGTEGATAGRARSDICGAGEPSIKSGVSATPVFPVRRRGRRSQALSSRISPRRAMS